MNSEEEQRLLAPVDEDDDSTTPKPDDVPEPCPRKRKGVTRSEFDNLQVQVSSVTAGINNFGDMLQSFIGDGKKPRFDDEVLAAQSASYPFRVLILSEFKIVCGVSFTPRSVFMVKTFVKVSVLHLCGMVIVDAASVSGCTLDGAFGAGSGPGAKRFVPYGEGKCEVFVFGANAGVAEVVKC